MFERLLERLAQILEKAGIPYMVIGGQAVLLYGEPRLTREIDLTLALGPKEISKLTPLLIPLQLKVLVPRPDQFVEETLVLPCQNPDSGIRVDFIFSLSPYERQAMGRVRKVPMGKSEVHFASLEDVVIQKIVSGRLRDLEDVRMILLKKPPYDRAYVDKWLGDFEKALERPLLPILRNLTNN